MHIQGSKRLSQMGSAIFAEVDQWKLEAAAQGNHIIDLGIGSPDLPPSSEVMQALSEAVGEPDNYSYPTSVGSLAFRSKAAEWLKWRFDAEVDPESEIVTLMGSQDGLAHLALALCNPGDYAFVPNPGYPIYAGGLALAGVEPLFIPLRAENHFLPDFEALPAAYVKQAKFLLLNYPSNPLAVTADAAFFERLVAFGRSHDLLIVHDLAYSEMAFDGFRPSSILAVPGAKEIAVEFHSLSKSFNMAGCRIAFLAGNRDVVAALRTLKSNVDFGVFKAIQHAGIAALEADMRGAGSNVSVIYEQRRDRFIERLAAQGVRIPPSQATMFLWVPIPAGYTSRQISREMLLETGVAVIPGDAFGSEGEGYVRIALVQQEDDLLEAADRIGQFLRRCV